MKRIKNYVDLLRGLWSVIESNKSDSKVIFARDYPEWYNFIGSNYPMFEFDVSSEEEIVENYFGQRGQEESVKTFFEEGEKLLSLPIPDFPWRTISSLGAGPEISTEPFENAADWKRWISRILDMAHQVIDSSL